MLLKEFTHLKTKLDRLYQLIPGLGYLYEQVKLHWWGFKGGIGLVGRGISFSLETFLVKFWLEMLLFSVYIT